MRKDLNFGDVFFSLFLNVSKKKKEEEEGVGGKVIYKERERRE